MRANPHDIMLRVKINDNLGFGAITHQKTLRDYLPVITLTKTPNTCGTGGCSLSFFLLVNSNIIQIKKLHDYYGFNNTQP